MPVTARRLACRVWLVDVTGAPPADLSLLNPAERLRRDTFRRDADRTRFTAAAALLRVAAGAELGRPPATIEVERRCDRCPAAHGRPTIPGTGLHVSVSHSGAFVAVAVTAAAPVGVDVEEITQRSIADLAPLCLGPEEVARHPQDFYTYWCRKESVVKATGDGLRVPLPAVRVSPAHAPPRLVAYQGSTMPAAMSDLTIAGGYAGALTVLADGELDVTTIRPGG